MPRSWRSCASEQNSTAIAQTCDQLGAFYTPIAVAIAIVAWLISGEATRFLVVLVIATPCPLLIAIPISIIGSDFSLRGAGHHYQEPGGLGVKSPRAVLLSLTRPNIDPWRNQARH
ncbi:MAG: hypothetical protein IPP40_16085 [bacterium]|nr:hypothetical protein [bacterium]